MVSSSFVLNGFALGFPSDSKSMIGGLDLRPMAFPALQAHDSSSEDSLSGDSSAEESSFSLVSFVSVVFFDSSSIAVSVSVLRTSLAGGGTSVISSFFGFSIILNPLDWGQPQGHC